MAGKFSDATHAFDSKSIIGGVEGVTEAELRI